MLLFPLAWKLPGEPGTSLGTSLETSLVCISVGTTVDHLEVQGGHLHGLP